MDGVARALAVVLASGTLMSVAPAQEPKYSADLLTLLDPTTRVTSLCGGAGPGSMRANLALAAMVVAGADLPKPEPLVDGLGQVNFAITTSNPVVSAVPTTIPAPVAFFPTPGTLELVILSPA